MCTAATYQTKDFYFGRTLDYEFSYGDEIVITPRNYRFSFRHMDGFPDYASPAPVAGCGQDSSPFAHYAMIGMAHVAENYPLYYEAVNEKGLGMAGLNFVGNARYREAEYGRENVAVFELIPWVLGQCATLQEAKKLLKKINLTNTPFSEKLPPASLHWLIAGCGEAVTVESVESGLHVYENPVGVLTNNPPFEEQMSNLSNYMSLSAKQPENRFCANLPLHAYSRGMGALGLPGDLSSQSRFVRAAFVKMNSLSGDTEEESVSQFFHILGSVDQQRGCCDLGGGEYEITLYTSCCNTDKGIYYYTTYNNHQISAVDMRREDLSSSRLIRYAPVQGEQILMQNHQAAI